MADEPHGTTGQGDRPDVHYAPTQAWQGPATPPPPPPPPGQAGQQGPPPPPPAPGGQPGGQPPAQAPGGVHHAPTQAWQGPSTPPPPAPPAAPQAPGGYGYPPAQPGGYGYSQQPQPQPQPQGGYGYPQPQPGAYGYPQPAPQPGWGGGYPQQPGQPMPPAGGGGGGRKNVIFAVVGVVTALALAVGGVVYFTGGDDGKAAKDDPKTTETGKNEPEVDKSDGAALAAAELDFSADRTTLWEIAADPQAAKDSSSLIGSWVTADSFVLGEENGITAYNLKTGEKTWTAQAPEAGAVPCTMSGEVGTDGKAAVLYRKASAEDYDPCTLLTVVDTKTGKPLWSKDVRPNADQGSDGSVSVDSENNRVFAITADMAFSYSLDAGQKNWEAGGGEYCSVSGKTTPTAIVAEQTCFDDDKSVVHSLNLEDGTKSLWSAPAPGDSMTKVVVLSATPAVVMINEGSAAARGYITTFDDKGTQGKEIRLAQSYGNLPDQSAVLGDLPAYHFQGSTMVAEISKGSEKTSTVAAFDLTTGAEKWHREVGTEDRGVQILGFDGDSILAAMEARYEDQGRLMHLALASGEPADGGSFPKDVVALVSLDYNRLVVRGNLILAMEAYASSYDPRVIAFSPK